MRAAKDKADANAPRTAAGRSSTMPRPDNGLPEDIREHMRLMCDIIALGVPDRQDPVATLLLVPRHLRPLLPVPRRPRGPPLAPRTTTSPTPTSGSPATTCSQLAYLADQLDAMPEGEGTVLDNSCLLFISNMWSGSKHDSHARCRCSWPAAWAGRSRPAACSTTPTSGDENRKLCSLYLSLMDRMGVKLDRFGDADQRLADL